VITENIISVEFVNNLKKHLKTMGIGHTSHAEEVNTIE